MSLGDEQSYARVFERMLAVLYTQRNLGVVTWPEYVAVLEHLRGTIGEALFRKYRDFARDGESALVRSRDTSEIACGEPVS